MPTVKSDNAEMVEICAAALLLFVYTVLDFEFCNAVPI